MAFTYVLSTSIGQVRLLIPDSNTLQYVFEDDEITAFLGMEGGTVKRAAALALETIASNETMVLKVIRLLDLSTDGAKTSDALLKRAALLRAQAAAESEDNIDGSNIDIAEMVIDGWQAADFAINSALRGG